MVFKIRGCASVHVERIRFASPAQPQPSSHSHASTTAAGTSQSTAKRRVMLKVSPVCSPHTPEVFLDFTIYIICIKVALRGLGKTYRDAFKYHNSAYCKPDLQDLPPHTH